MLNSGDKPQARRDLKQTCWNGCDRLVQLEFIKNCYGNNKQSGCYT